MSKLVWVYFSSSSCEMYAVFESCGRRLDMKEGESKKEREEESKEKEEGSHGREELRRNLQV